MYCKDISVDYRITKNQRKNADTSYKTETLQRR